MNDALIKDGPGPDYILNELGENLVWIRVNNVSVYVRRTDEGVAVDLYPAGRELEDALAGTWCLFSEAEPDEDDSSHYTE